MAAKYIEETGPFFKTWLIVGRHLSILFNTCLAHCCTCLHLFAFAEILGVIFVTYVYCLVVRLQHAAPIMKEESHDTLPLATTDHRQQHSKPLN